MQSDYLPLILIQGHLWVCTLPDMCTCTREWACRHVYMHTCMSLQTCTHAHIYETVLRKRFQFTEKLYYTHKALHKIRQHSQMGKNQRGLSFSRGEWRKQTATDSLGRFISTNVKLAGVGAGIPHLHHQLSIKTLSSLVHKLLLSEKKKVSKENLTGDSIQNDGNHCWGVTAFLRNGRSAPPSFLAAWPPAGTCFQFSRCPDSYYVSLAMTARTTRESCPLWIRSGLPLAACEVGAGTHDDHVLAFSNECIV